MSLLKTLFSPLGKWLSVYLQKTHGQYEQFSLIPSHVLQRTLQPGDVLLVEGNSRISTAIKYLTQSTWSHACLYTGHNPEKPLIEVDLVDGVIEVPLNKYDKQNLRICRPVNLTDSDQKQLVNFATTRLGYQYDHSNIVDLARFLLPTPPIPEKYRRNMLAFGSGDPTRAICSTLIAQAFMSIKYPILPRTLQVCFGEECSLDDQILLEARHYSHFVPRDFDLSPFFAVVKPLAEPEFNYTRLRWADTNSISHS